MVNYKNDNASKSKDKTVERKKARKDKQRTRNK